MSYPQFEAELRALCVHTPNRKASFTNIREHKVDFMPRSVKNPRVNYGYVSEFTQNAPEELPQFVDLWICGTDTTIYDCAAGKLGRRAADDSG